MARVARQAAIYATEGISEDAKLPTLEAAIVATSTASGALMMALGQARLGNIVRLLPSPVTGGFLAGTGWVLTSGAFKVLTGLTFTPSNALEALRSPELLTVGLPGVALGLALAVGNRKIGKFWVVPSFLLGGSFLYFAGLEFGPLGMSPTDALAAGFLLGPFDAESVSASFSPLLLSPETLAKVRWDVVFDQGPRGATVFGLSTLGLLLITSAVEISTGREGDANEELKAVGASNVVSGLAGGLITYHSLSSTQIAHRMGSESRLPGLVCGAVYAAALVVGPAPLAYVPSSLIGGLLLFIGVSFLYEWLVEGLENLPRSEYAVVALITATVAVDGYLAGVVAGILGAAAVFVTDYSRVPIVRSRLRIGGVGGLRSSVSRTRAEVDVIVKRGMSVYGAKLQGFLFFATAYKLLEEIKAQHEGGKREGRPLTYILLDFQNVVGVDGSAISVFEKLRRFATRENIELVLADVDRPELARVVTITIYGEDMPTFAFVDRVNARAIAPALESMNATGDILASDVSGRVVQIKDLDTALKFAEDRMISEAAMDVAAAVARGEISSSADDGDEGVAAGFQNHFDEMVASVCSTPEEERVFRGAWRPVQFEAGQVVCERGEVADRIYFIEESAVVKVEMARGLGDGESNEGWDPQGAIEEETSYVTFTSEQLTSSGAEETSEEEEREGGATAIEDGEGEGGEDGSEVSEGREAGGDSVGSAAAKMAGSAGISALAAKGLSTVIGPAIGATGAGAIASASGMDPTAVAQTVVASGELSANIGNIGNIANVVPEVAAAGIGGAAAAVKKVLGDRSEKNPEDDAGVEKAADEPRVEEVEDEFSIRITGDFIGAVGFYRQGGVGKVRFGRLVVERPGSGYVMYEDDVEALEKKHPYLALKFHRMMAGTLANSVISRNKLITQYVR